MRWVQGLGVNQAFILGAGLGTRLRPLTDQRPKPLVPLFHRPLAAWAMDACKKVGATRFAINTHHLPEQWEGFAEADDVTLHHEPILLETGGGLKNIEPWLEDGPLLVHNGDIFSTMPLERLIDHHERSGLPVTLALRSEGSAKHIAFDPDAQRVDDIRSMLGRRDGEHVFTGVYCINPEFLSMIPAGQKVSVIPAFVELAKAGRLGAVLLDEGDWLDLGDRDSYLRAHRELDLGPRIHPSATIANGVVIENSVIGAGAVIGEGAVIRDSVVWEEKQVADGALLESCILCCEGRVEGIHRGVDL